MIIAMTFCFSWKCLLLPPPQLSFSCLGNVNTNKLTLYLFRCTIPSTNRSLRINPDSTGIHWLLPSNMRLPLSAWTVLHMPSVTTTKWDHKNTETRTLSFFNSSYHMENLIFLVWVVFTSWWNSFDLKDSSQTEHKYSSCKWLRVLVYHPLCSKISHSILVVKPRSSKRWLWWSFFKSLSKSLRT